MFQFQKGSTPRMVLALAFAAACGLPAAFAGNGSSDSSSNGVLFAGGASNKALTPTNQQIPNKTDKATKDAPPNGTDDGVGGVAEACMALPFPLDFVMLEGLYKEAEYARAYVAGEVGTYNRQAYLSSLNFLFHFEAMVRGLSVVDVQVPWGSNGDDAGNESPVIHEGEDVDTGDAGNSSAE